MRSSTPPWLWKLDAEHRLLIAVGVAIVGFFSLPNMLGLGTRSITAWDMGIVSLLLLTWSVILTAHPHQIQHRARTDDTNRLIVAILVVGAASASLMAVLFLLHIGKSLPPTEEALEVALCAIAVVASWLVVHTTFCLRYAHHYYNALTHSGSAHHTTPPDTEPKIVAGLEFPDEQHPDYLDFAYFAFTIGMTAQTSDVQVNSRLMRRLTLVHGMLSFVFNTVVVALSVNIISQLL
jgi:uncharacterized membrane protein